MIKAFVAFPLIFPPFFFFPLHEQLHQGNAGHRLVMLSGATGLVELLAGKLASLVCSAPCIPRHCWAGWFEQAHESKV